MFNSDVDEVVKKAIYELQVDSRDEFYIFLSKKVIPDVMNFAQYSGKDALKKYAELLQNEYSTNSEFSELVIKRFIKYLVPKILMDAEPSQDENVNTLLSTDDKHIIQYLLGAIIKWGVKNCSGSRKEWCQTQISYHQDFENSRFRTANRDLICPVDKFLRLIIHSETEFRKQKSRRKIFITSILESLPITKIYPEIDDFQSHVLHQLLTRYIRMRSHISCTHASRKHTAATKRKREKPSNAIRKILKSNNSNVKG